MPGPADQLAWTAGSMQRLLARQDYPSLLFVSALGKTLVTEGEKALDGLDPVVGALTARPTRGASATGSRFASSLSGGADPVGACRAETDPSRGTICAMERLVPLAPPALGRELTEEGVRLLGLYAAAPAQARGASLGAAASALSPAPFDPLQSFAEGALGSVWQARSRAAGEPSSLAPRMDGLLSGVLGFSPSDGAESVMVRSPELRRLLAAHPTVSAPLGFRTGGTPLGGLSTAPAAGLDGVMTGYHGFLSGVAASLGSTPDVSSASEWAAGRSFVYLAARSAELSGADRGVSDRIRSLGAAAVDLQRGTADFPGQVMSRGRDLAIAALTGNVLGFATRITSFFQGSSGGFGPGAADELRTLREGVQRLGRDVGAGFAGVDSRFDELFSVLDGRFAHLEGLVATSGRDVRAEIAAVHLDVLALGARLDRMDEDLRSYMQAGFDRDYMRTLVRCLEHRERYAPPFDQMELGVFSACLADLRVRAVDDARDALLTDQATPLDDLSLTQALSGASTQDLARRLPLLARAASQRYAYGGLGSGRTLANPLEWAVAAQAYLALLRDWPDHARAVTAVDLERMWEVGTDVRDALQAVTLDPATGAPGALLPAVLASYEASVASLTTEAALLARRHRQEGLRHAPASSILVTLTPADGPGPLLPVPSAVAAALPPEVRTAAVLGLDSARLTYRLVREDSVARGDARRRWLVFGKRHDRFTYSRVSVEVELTVGTLHGLASYRATGPFHLRRTDRIAGDHDSDRSVGGVDHVPDVASHFLAADWPELAAEWQAWTTTTPEHFVLELLEQRVQDELRGSSTSALAAVIDNACGGQPGATGLSGPDRESSLRIRSTLASMSATRALLEAYVRLGLPRSLEEDAALRGALLGNDAILDREGLCSLVESDAHPLRLVWLDEEPQRRATLLRAALDRSLERAAREPELLPAVAATLDQLEVAIRVQRLRTRNALGAL